MKNAFPVVCSTRFISNYCNRNNFYFYIKKILFLFSVIIVQFPYTHKRVDEYKGIKIGSISEGTYKYESHAAGKIFSKNKLHTEFSMKLMLKQKKISFRIFISFIKFFASSFTFLLLF